MILLNRLYSDTHLFDEVKFNKGINIVLGKYSGEKSQFTHHGWICGADHAGDLWT